MPSFDIVKEVKPDETFRVNNIINNFDLDVEHIHEHFTGNIDIEGKDWNVGLIVGGSGTGKSTIAKQCFADNYIKGYEYSAKSVIDDMPKDKGIKDIEKVFTSVGFASPPSWLKPYDVLSNGEKMRVDLARSILEDTDEKHFFTVRESTTALKSNLKYTGLTMQLKKTYGKYLESITI